MRPVAALKARVRVRQGRLADALGWARERGLSVEDDLSYLREFEHITLARVLLAQRLRPLQRIGAPGAPAAAADAGGGRAASSRSWCCRRSPIRRAATCRAALAPLERALTLAEPEGYVRMFVDEGPPMAALLQAAAKRGIAPGYVRRLLAASGTAEDSRTPARQALVEPLSERELDVLRLLATDLDGPTSPASSWCR